MNFSRRDWVRSLAYGSGLLALRSLASGIPLAVLTDPRRALAADPSGSMGFANPQFLIMSTSQAGDPLNCNAPGTYLDPKIAHPADPRMAKASIHVGGQSWDVAAPWTSLAAVAKAPNVLSRTSFIHHDTGTEQHLQEPDVLGLMGAVAVKNMAVSAFAAQLAPVLGTIQAQPVTVGTADSSEAISYLGRPQPLLNPMSLAQVLGKPTGPVGTLQKQRDQDLNKLNAFLKESGTKAQRDFIDRYATSQTQVRQISTDLLSRLSSIKDNGADSQVQAAIVLIQMKIAPVVTIHIPFGGDNHFDGNLQQEADQTVTGMATIVNLLNGLTDANLADSVTFASFNVFGRTLTMQGAGRSHNRNHHLSLLIGKNVRGSVIGGVTPVGDDYGAMPIDSTSGKADDNGDIAVVDSLASVGKTMAAALGMPADQIDKTIVYASTGAPAGKVIKAAIAS